MHNHIIGELLEIDSAKRFPNPWATQNLLRLGWTLRDGVPRNPIEYKKLLEKLGGVHD